MRVPVSTYRIQFAPAFDFQSVTDILDYLSNLGITDLYASPIFKPRQGSEHGYDMVDPERINPELGAEQGFEKLVRKLKKKDMGLLLDVVPNHMAYDKQNRMIMDVLESGPCSKYFHFFDIQWEHFSEGLRSRILAPFLGKIYSQALESAEIQLSYDDNGLAINYYDLRFPLRIESYPSLFSHELSGLEQRLGPNSPAFIKFIGTVYTLENMPSRERREERYEQVSFAKRMLRELYLNEPAIREHVDGNIRAFNGSAGDPAGFALLDGLLSEQLFRLSFWKVANEEINYRRFFSINDLICMRPEHPEVFERTHALLFRLLGEGVTGIRIDHIDGLLDPAAYLGRIKQEREVYVVVEKILQEDEELRPSWEVEGTTGYDFLDRVSQAMVEMDNEKAFDRIYSGFGYRKAAADELVRAKKRLIMAKHMAGEVDNLAHLLKRSSIRDRYGKDITMYGLRRALVELMAFFPVYRSYVSEEGFEETDWRCINRAIEGAERYNPELLYELGFIKRFIAAGWGNEDDEGEREQALGFIMRMQQFTGPLMAKGYEDTYLYVYNRLISLNEVGGRPQKFGASIQDFHDFNCKRAEKWPHTLSATSTHDAKRGEDVRARINVLSEMPAEFEKHLRYWRKSNGPRKRSAGGVRAPDDNDEYFLYQTLLGAYPFSGDEHDSFVARIKEYVVKAVREAKVHTGWLKPDEQYENTYMAFVDSILSRSGKNRFMGSFLPFQRKVAFYGVFNSLSQTLIKITAPGVPDFYQGSELWDLSLVDPDNRRPVDFDARKRALAYIKEKERTGMQELIYELYQDKENGWIKLFLVYRALKARSENIELFQKGDYIPLETGGKYGRHLIAFARRLEDKWCLTLAPRLLVSVVNEGDPPMGKKVWGDTFVALPREAPTRWEDALTGTEIQAHGSTAAADALSRFPAALLSGER